MYALCFRLNTCIGGVCPVFSYTGLAHGVARKTKGSRCRRVRRRCVRGSLVFPKKYSTYHFLKPSPMEDEKMEEVMPVDGQPTTSKEFCWCACVCDYFSHGKTMHWLTISCQEVEPSKKGHEKGGDLSPEVPYQLFTAWTLHVFAYALFMMKHM